MPEIGEQRQWLARVLPFALYMLFIAVQGGVLSLYEEPSQAPPQTIPLLYLVKIVVVAAALVYFWKSFEELKLPKIAWPALAESLLIGGVVFALWVNMDWEFGTMGEPPSYDPQTLPDHWLYPFFALRIMGAALVVPIFEELFWRSFILRYIVNPEFTKVPLGSFTWGSFIFTAILFGLEHHLWIAGIMAGIFYALLLYRTRHLFYCILAHGVTNLLLGVYVIKTGNWYFW